MIKEIIGIIVLIVWLVAYIKMDMTIDYMQFGELTLLKAVAVFGTFIVGLILIVMFMIG